MNLTTTISIMKLNSIKMVMGGMLGATMLLGIHSCSDDHYDIKDGTASARNTIWQNIQANDQLDSLSIILSRTRVYTKEEDKKRTLTYAELLNEPQSFTFWAPKDGTYNAKQFLDRLDHAASLRSEAAGKTGLEADNLIEQADKIEYNVGLQFAQNHMARFNYEGSTTSTELRLFNGKLVSYVPSVTFNGVNIDADMPNIPSSNGVIHVIDNLSPFSFNIYDYLGEHSDKLSSVYDIIMAQDTLIFQPNQSTQGSMNSQGQMVYVDSVYSRQNTLLDKCGAQVRNEDSLYVAVIPTDPAWAEASAKVAKLFNYASYYKYDYNGGASPSQAFPTRFPTKGTYNSDSLKKYNVNQALITSMFFTVTNFTGDFKRNQPQQIANYAMHADSLVSTNGKIYYNPNKGGLNPLFGEGTYDSASNGIVFPLTSYNYDPSNWLMSDNVLDMNNEGNVGNCYAGGTPSKGEYIYLTEGDNLNDTIDVSSLEKKAYRYFAGNRNTALNIFFPLRDVFSGKYRIRALILPNRVNLNNRWMEEDAEGKETEIMQNTKFFAKVFDDEGKLIGSQSEDIVVDDTKPGIYTLFDGIEIPKCYYNLPTGVSNCYPLLQLSIPNNNAYQPHRRNFGPALSIVKLYVEPVRE